MQFSILTITLNAERYLKTSLASVAEQTYPEVEHILLDGGSEDATLEIAQAFPHVKIYRGIDNGISDAMNKAAALATGDFILHLHADDRFASCDVLEKVATALKQHPQINWLFGRAHILDEMGSVKRSTPFLPDALERLTKYNTITHPSVIVSRSLFQAAGGFSLKWHYCMDYDLWLRLKQIGKGFAYPAVIGCFREHKGSLSTSSPKKVASEAHLIRCHYLKNPWKKFRSYRTYLKRIDLLHN